MMPNERQAGFTIAEIFIVAAMLFASGFFVYSQWQYFNMVERNAERKTAINAIHYYLQEVYFPKHGSYPVTLDSETITAIDEDQLRDPSGRFITNYQSDLRYDPGGCGSGACQRYTLRADLEKAADFIRRSG